MKTKMKKRRIEIIDIAKAITIFCVILGHTTGNLDTPLFRRVLYSFHMPLFFALAGLSMKPKGLHGWNAWKGFLKKNILALIAPYLIWGLVYAPFSYQSVPLLFYGSWEALTTMDTLTSLWYLPCFFVSKIIVEIILTVLEYVKTEKITLWSGICAIPLFVIGFLIPHPENGYLWCVDIALTGAGFILLGIAVRRTYIIVAQQKTIWLIVLSIGSLLLFCAGSVFRGDALDLCLMCKASYGSVFWFMYNSVFGSMTVLSLSMLLSRLSRESAHPFSISAVTYTGRQTMGIYLLHKPFLQQVILPFLSKVMGSACPFLAVAVIGTCLALLFSIALCFVVEKFIPQLLGQFQQNEWAAPEKTQANPS